MRSSFNLSARTGLIASVPAGYTSPQLGVGEAVAAQSSAPVSAQQVPVLSSFASPGPGVCDCGHSKNNHWDSIGGICVRVDCPCRGFVSPGPAS